MSAKVPNTAVPSVRDQWPVQRSQGVAVRGDSAGQGAHRAEHFAAPDRQGRMSAHMSSEARVYSRYANAARYASGCERDEMAGALSDGGMSGAYEGATSSTGKYVIPYVIYGVVALLLEIAWFVWVKATVAGSVMGEPLHFAIGVVLLVAVLVVGAILSVVVGLVSRARLELSTFDALAVSMGKTAIGMGAFVVVWVVLMFLAA